MSKRKIKFRLLALGVALLMAQVGLLYIVLSLSGGLGSLDQEGGQTSETAENAVENRLHTDFGDVELMNVSDKYEELKESYNELKASKDYEYSIRYIYDLDRDYIGDTNLVGNISLEDLIISPEIFGMPQSLYEYYMNADILKDMYSAVDASYTPQAGDVVWLKIFSTVDGQNVAYLSNVYNMYVMGDDSYLPDIQGLDDIIAGKTAGQTFEITGKAPDGKTVQASNDSEPMDISGKDVVFNVTICQISQVSNAGPTDGNASLVANSRGIIGVTNLAQYDDYVLRNYAYTSGMSNLDNYLLKFQSNENLQKSLNTHLSLVAASVADGNDSIDTYGPIYSELRRVKLSEAYGKLYEQLPDYYKYDPSSLEDVKNLLNKINYSSYSDEYVKEFKKSFQTEDQFSDYIKSYSVLVYLTDTNEIKTIEDAPESTPESAEAISENSEGYAN